MRTNNLAPIVIFVYARPNHTQRMLESLEKNEQIKDSIVYIFCDAPKNEKTKEKNSEVKRIIENYKKKSKAKRVTISYAESNQGLATSVIAGVTKIIKKEKKVIVLEDDLEVSESFLEYMNNALEQYKNNKRIWSISGYKHEFKIPKKYTEEVFLGYRASSWGWATWEDRWDLIDWEVKDYEKFHRDRKKRKLLNRGGNDMAQMLDSQMSGKCDSWAIRWCYTQSKQNMLTLFPVKPLVKNIGLDGTGTHSPKTKKFDVKLAHKSPNLPEKISLNQKIAKNYKKIFNGGIKQKIIEWSTITGNYNKISKAFHLLKQSRAAKNSFWIITERIIQAIISLIIGSISARYLGPGNYGLINYGASIVSFFTAIANLGLNNTIVKEYIENRKKHGEIIGSALILRAISSLLSIIMVLIAVIILRPNDQIIFVLTSLQSLVLLFQIYEVFELWFQSKLESKTVSFIKTFASILVAGYKIFLLITGKPVEWFAASTTIDSLLIFLLSYLYYKKSKDNNQKISFNKITAKRLVANSRHYIISGMMVTIYMHMDKIMLGNMMDESEVGFYAAATTICTMWCFIPEAIINSIKPLIFEAKTNNEKRYEQLLRLLYCITFWLCSCFSLLISLFSRLIINILYGETFMPTQTILIIAIWYTAFAYLGVARNAWIVSEEKNRYAKYFTLIGVIVNLSLNFILIPNYGGVGAAIATLISQFSTAVLAPLCFKNTRISTKYMIDGILFRNLH